MQYSKQSKRRYLCDVLEDMRDNDKFKNYGSQEALIEEAQRFANNMESALTVDKDFDRVFADFDELAKCHKEIFQMITILFPEIIENEGWNSYRKRER